MPPIRPIKLTLYYALPFVLTVTALFLFLLFLERKNLEIEQEEQLTHTAAALIDQIVVTRLWNAQHSGVYARITPATPPNPYLEDRERDITSTSGKHYTKLNPAYMTRQIADLARSHYGYRFSITSLKPLNPVNRPDPWEQEALLSFENGAPYRRDRVSESGSPVFRYMVPLPTEQSCLACHAKQQYRLGDVRGGIRVSVPMAESNRIYRSRSRAYLAAGTALWLSIIVFIMLVSYTLSRKVVREMTREFELSRLRTAMEMAGAAAHEIRQPLTALLTYFDILKMRFAQDQETVKELDIMAHQCRRIDDMIARMLNITEYRTKDYVGDIRIADIDSARKETGP